MSTNQSTETPRVAWKVEIRSMSCIVFATTKAKAQWIAVKGYREAYGHRRGEWPGAKAWRVPEYDRSVLRFDPYRNGFTEDHVIDSPQS